MTTQNLPDDVKRDVEAVARKAAQEKALSGLKKVAASGDLREVQRTLDVARRAGLPAEKTKDAEALADTLDSLSVATDCRDGAAIRSALAAFQAATSVAPRSTCGVTVARGLEVLDELRKAAAADAVRMKAEPSSVGKSAQKAKKAEADGMGAGAADASGGGDGEGGKEGAPRGDEAALEGEGSEARRKLKKQIAYEAWLSEKKHEKEARVSRIPCSAHMHALKPPVWGLATLTDRQGGGALADSRWPGLAFILGQFREGTRRTERSKKR